MVYFGLQDKVIKMNFYELIQYFKNVLELYTFLTSVNDIFCIWKRFTKQKKSNCLEKL